MRLKRYIESIKEEEIDDFREDQNDEIAHLCTLLRQLYKNAGVSHDVYIESEDFDIIIYIVLNKIEKIKTFMKLLDVTKKVQDDILIQYNTEFELWETKAEEPLMTISFIYKPDKNDSQDGAPF